MSGNMSVSGKGIKMNFEKAYTYPTFVYESDKQYFADCVALNLISSGDSPFEALENLKQKINNFLKGQSFTLKPLFEKR